MIKQRINTFVAIGMVVAVGVGASYLIIDFANNTEFFFLSSSYSVDGSNAIEAGR